MPVLTVKKCSPLSRTSGRATAAASRSATSVTPRPASTSGQITTNSSPPRRATVSVTRTAAVSRGPRASSTLVARGVAEGVVDRLEAVEVEHEHGDVDALALPAGQRVSEAVERERAVGQPGERVVQRGMARDLLLAVALDGDDDQRGDGRQEADLVLGEGARLARMRR